MRGSIAILIGAVIIAVGIYIYFRKAGLEGFATGEAEVYALSLYDINLSAQAAPYISFDTNKNAIASAFNATIATKAQMQAAYDAGSRWNKACIVSDDTEMYFTDADTQDLKSTNISNINQWKGGILLYGLKPALDQIPANSPLFANTQIPTIFNNPAYVFRVWGWNEPQNLITSTNMQRTIVQKYKSTTADDSDTLNGQYRLGYSAPAAPTPVPTPAPTPVPTPTPGPIGSSSSSAAVSTGPGSIGSSSSSAAVSTGAGPTAPPQVPQGIGSSSSSQRPQQGTGGTSGTSGTDLQSLIASLTNALTNQERCADAPNRRPPARIRNYSTPNDTTLPPPQPPLNVAHLVATVASLQPSTVTTDDSSVQTIFIRKYNQLRRIPPDDNDSILLIYTQFRNFYDNFYSILDDNNRRIFRELNFDIQARLINIINQFNRDTMIALHYSLDPNFVVEDVADAGAQAATAADSIGGSDAYSMLKPRILSEIEAAIRGQLQESCRADGAGGASGAGAGAGGASGGAGAGGQPDAGSGPVPPYVPPAGGSGSLPTLIPPTLPGSASMLSTAAAAAAAAAKAAADARAATAGTGAGLPSCPPGTCQQTDACNATDEQRSNWQYMILPSAGAAKCSEQPKAAPSLIWGE